MTQILTVLSSQSTKTLANLPAFTQLLSSTSPAAMSVSASAPAVGVPHTAVLQHRPALQQWHGPNYAAAAVVAAAAASCLSAGGVVELCDSACLETADRVCRKHSESTLNANNCFLLHHTS
jgi:hypothetical protein